MPTLIRYQTFDIDPEAGLVLGLRGQPIGSADTSGYLQIDARRRGLGILSAHRLIWEAVNGPLSDDLEVNHKDGMKTNNRIANLEAITHQDNILHAYRTGLKSNRGEKHPCHRLTEAAVRDIRRRRRGGETVTALATEFGVTTTTISFAVSGKTWSHIGD